MQAGPFTSDLSVNELLLLRGAGFRPLRQVMGSCFYNVGWQAMTAGMGRGQVWGGRGTEGQTAELAQQTEAWNEARRLALTRMADEARAGDADAVVGVHLRRSRRDRATGMIEFVAVGTAVRGDRYDLGEDVALSNLSGQEFAKLFAHGWAPVGLVAGSSVAYVAAGWNQQASSKGTVFGAGGGLGFGTQFRNQELPDFTRGFTQTRLMAMQRLERQAHELHAHGVIGVRVEHTQNQIERDTGGSKYNDLIVELHVLGTAIVELQRDAARPPTYLDFELNTQEQP